ncbi:hypothetical protein CNMCM5793_001591 [Aspergillus hiratsukae]|uniref:Xylanolytic transcriptional activator regulatory domain-containing protein n=1 Tax=Aspergillus hiratsukae TaxID=1194566 RepID=A0A8H6Q1L1_9EURO|nr:hypothetical protein CNMCM5793_001591 [Aspergillus hiratsukae]KAF7164109.1 hypothetical protein CNMCM6106_000767 [Aspergillus hiratsukae]
MVAINLFHEPSFAEKLLAIPSLHEVTGLLAGIAAYASHFLLLENHPPAGDEVRFAEASHRQSAHFVNLAFNHIHAALAECGDEMPSLCVIQALIVATHCQLTRGVHGKAWRSLGLCVRLAYETNLHLLDSRMVVKMDDPVQWQADEEKRRAFWAIWEMDVFASTIRRTPTAIDWRQMEILLPVDNENWFQCRPAQSCFMEADANQRWKALRDSNNASPKAWFLVINSLMKAAQIISNPRGVPLTGDPDNYQPTYRNSTPESVIEARQKLETVANAVRCFSLALPSHLQYRDQPLFFGSPEPGQVESQRQQHCSIYNIFVMTQLARLMIHRYDAFRPQTRGSEINGRHLSGNSAESDGSGIHKAESVALRHYFEAADSILRIVNQSSGDHIQHINPFLSSTIWLASAVQLVRKHFVRTSAERNLVKSRFDVLYYTYMRCVEFWDTQTALQHNLESLELQLEAAQGRPNTRDRPFPHKSSKVTWTEATSTVQSATDHQLCPNNRDPKRQRRSPHATSHGTQQDNATTISSSPKVQDNPLTQFISEKPPVVGLEIPPPDLNQDGLQGMSGQEYLKKQPNPMDGMTVMDFMPVSQVNRTEISESEIMPMDPLFFDSNNPVNSQQDQYTEWCNFIFPSGMHDLLAGWSTY